MKPLCLMAFLPFMSPAANYTAEKITVDSTEVVRLADAARKIEVLVLPSFGNNAYSMKVNGKQILWNPYETLAELKAKPMQVGSPFLSPWVNRIDQDAYYANGKRYLLNPDLKNFRYDPNHKPIHGLLVYASQWRIVTLKADARQAQLTCRLEFWREPDWMAQFPFAHAIEMTHRLKDGALETETAIENLSTAPMPVSHGFHTYYQIPGVARDDYKVTVPAREHVLLNDVLIPTGEKKPVEFAPEITLRDYKLDDVFTGLIRQPDGTTTFTVAGGGKKISVVYGPKYDVAVIYAPPGREFICFEPMTCVTNAFNLAHAGKFQGLQSIPPGKIWKESFWIRPEGAPGSWD